MVKEELLIQMKKDFEMLSEKYRIKGIMLFGSQTIDSITSRSDVDICVVAPDENSFTLYSFLSVNLNLISKKYDIKFFTELPLYIQIQIIENGIVVYSPDELDLFEYFYPFRKLWADQIHRQELTKEELLNLLE